MSSEKSHFDEILATTRSVRRRIDFERAIEEDVLLECIDLAVQAPTGAGAESWRFVVVTDIEKKVAMAELYRRAFDNYLAQRDADEAATTERDAMSPNYRFLADHLQDFPALVLVCREGRPPEHVPAQLAFYGSVLPAAWSLMIALRARGLGSTWTTLISAFETEAAAVLEIPTGVTATVLLPVGHMKGAVLRRAERRPAREVTFWNGWGEQNGS